MLEIILYGLRTIAVLLALSRAQAPARQSEEHVMRDRFRVTDVLRPRPGQDEFFVRIADRGVNLLDTETFEGAYLSRSARDGA